MSKINRANSLPDLKPLLTPRELEVAELVSEECSPKMIAMKLHMALRTVGSHVRNIHSKTHKHNAAGVSNYLRELRHKR